MSKSPTRPGKVRNAILVGDARTALDQVPDASVDTVITSPPYFRLRDYQQPNQIGLEAQVDQWVNELLVVARGLRRVLKPSGSLWLNLGDTFARASGEGASPKSLLLAPERFALAMCKDGWVLRNKVVWAKPNPMPTSIRDRLSCTWEVVYFFSRERRYFFNLDAIRVPHAALSRSPAKRRPPRLSWSVPRKWRGPSAGSNAGLDRLKASGLPGHPLGKNPGDVWTLPTANYHGPHHAVFPERLVERPLLATCPERVCASCGIPWSRLAASSQGPGSVVGNLRKSCPCTCREYQPGLVLDPFIGAGTTAVVAERHRRDWIGIELNHAFVVAATNRIAAARSHRQAA